MLPNFSIITPSFRQLDWLRLAAASIADQQGVTVEHIVQDAGTYGIDEFFQSNLVAKDAAHGSKLFVEKDAGMYDAVNRGLAKARGEICAYLNCDEQLLPNALREVAAFFDRHPKIDVLFGDSILINKSGTPLSYRRTVVPILSYVENVQLNAPTCATFFRRSIIDQGLLFDPQWKIIGDQVWIEDLLRTGVRMGTLSKPLAVFTFTDENLSSTALSQEEGKRHNPSHSPLARMRKGAHITVHRTRKLLAGAYQFRRVEIDIYSLESPTMRVRRTATVGYGWPKI